MNLPQNWTDLYNLLANPITFGVLISMVLAQWAYMNDKDKPNSVKMLIVLGVCLVWSTLVAVLSPSGFVLTKDSAYQVLLLAFSVAFSSQIWHSVVSPFIAQIIAILFGTAQLLFAHAAQMKAQLAK